MPKKDYSKKRFTHPMKHTKKKRPPINASVKKYLIRTAVVGGVFGALWAVFFSPWLNVKNISVEGAERADVHTVAWHWLSQQSTQKSFGQFAGHHLFFVPAKNLEELLIMDKFINSITVEKKFPNTLVLRINERTGSLAYFFNDARHIIDGQGFLIETTEALLGENDQYMGLPMVFGTSTDSMVVGDESLFTAELTWFVTALHAEFPKLFESAAITQFVLGGRGDTLTAVMSEGWYALFDPSVDLTVQLSNLARVYHETIDEPTRKRLEYIDVRLENYAYYK